MCETERKRREKERKKERKRERERERERQIETEREIYTERERNDEMTIRFLLTTSTSISSVRIFCFILASCDCMGEP